MSVYDRIPTDYWDAHTSLIDARGRELEERPLGYATRLYRGEACFGLVHHRTVVVCYYADDSVAVTTGGWHSPTTKARINAALSASPWSVGSHRGVWYWWYRGSGLFCEYDDGERVFLDPGRPGRDGIYHNYTAAEALEAKAREYPGAAELEAAADPENEEKEMRAAGLEALELGHRANNP